MDRGLAVLPFDDDDIAGVAGESTSGFRFETARLIASRQRPSVERTSGV
jgi:hypothetical protein